jgi:hypothetical protein
VFAIGSFFPGVTAMEENRNPTGGSDNPPPRLERPWQEEQRALSDIDQKINRLGGSQPPGRGSGGRGSGSGRWGGIGVVLLIGFGIRVLFGLMRASHSTDYTPPPQHYAPVKLDDHDWQPRIDEMMRDAQQRENRKRDLRIDNDPLDVRQPPLKATQRDPRPLPRKDQVGPPEP